MFKKFRNGPYDCIVTDNLFCYISDGHPTNSDPKFFFLYEIRTIFPSVRFMLSYKYNEYFDISIEPHKTISKEDIHKALRIFKFNDSFESKLED